MMFCIRWGFLGFDKFLFFLYRRYLVFVSNSSILPLSDLPDHLLLMSVMLFVCLLFLDLNTCFKPVCSTSVNVLVRIVFGSMASFS